MSPARRAPRRSSSLCRTAEEEHPICTLLAPCTNAFLAFTGALEERADAVEAREFTRRARDVVGSLTRVNDTLDFARESRSNVIDVNLNVQPRRVNDGMMTLTTVRTVSLPLAFLGA